MDIFLFINHFNDENLKKIQKLINKNGYPIRQKKSNLFFLCLFVIYSIFIIYGLLSIENFSHYYVYIFFVLALLLLNNFVNSQIRKPQEQNAVKWTEDNMYDVFFISEKILDNTQEQLTQFLAAQNELNDLKESFSKKDFYCRWVNNPNLQKFVCSIDSPEYFILVSRDSRNKSLFFPYFFIIPIQKNTHNLKLMSESTEFQVILDKKIDKKIKIK